MKKQCEGPAVELVERSPIGYLGTVDGEGKPYIKAMLKTANEGLKTFWFCSNTSSRRAGQLEADPNACLYFADQENFEGLLLSGTARVRRDPKILSRFWQPEMVRYYPEGVEDEDYCVIEFTADAGNYYHGLHNHDFTIQ
jgi:general stress protein 26